MADGSLTAKRQEIALLRRLEERILWLAAWTIHNANHLRESRDGLKVGGHQASCASMTTLMTALYMKALRPKDRVAVKPHASPVFHAIQHLFGRQSLENLQKFRSMGGAQSYPSRTKDVDDVDFSTGSVGLGVAQTLFSSLTQQDIDLALEAAAAVGDDRIQNKTQGQVTEESWTHGSAEQRQRWFTVGLEEGSLDACDTFDGGEV